MRLTLSLLPLALLTACGDSGDASDNGRSATGEVLEGTISDDMLPLTTVGSQPPLLPPELQDGNDDDKPAGRGATPSPAATSEEGASPPARSTPAEPASPASAEAP